jgi:hypothetical protein
MQEAAASPPTVFELLQQCGDGLLRDKSYTCAMFRDRLRFADCQDLERYLEQVLQAPHKQGGFILQDIVNTLGERMGFNVQFGRYQGTTKSIGFDGLWHADDLSLVVEVKTTDAFRIAFDTLLGYARAIATQEGLEEAPPVLLVTGRIDTGDIEAQIRGSRVDDKISVLGADSLLGLAKSATELSGGPALQSLRHLLIPRDHTRLDFIATLVASTIIESQHATIERLLEEGEQKGPPMTPIDASDDPRQATVACLGGSSLEKVSGNHYISDNGGNILVLFSRRYPRSDQQFWYSFSSKWEELLKKPHSGVALCLEGKRYYFFMTGDEVLANLPYLNFSEGTNARQWHLALKEEHDRFFLLRGKADSNLDLAEFKRPFGAMK